MKDIDVYVDGQVGGSNKSLNARFYWDCVKDGDGFKDVPFIMLATKCGKRQVVKRANEKLIKDYNQEYQAFLNLKPRTPLLALHLMPSQIKELEKHGITCVEDFETNSAPGFEQFQAAANVLNNLRGNYEKATENLRSGGHDHRERQDNRTQEVQQNQSVAGSDRNREASQENQKINQEVLMSWDFAI